MIRKGFGVPSQAFYYHVSTLYAKVVWQWLLADIVWAQLAFTQNPAYHIIFVLDVYVYETETR